MTCKCHMASIELYIGVCECVVNNDCLMAQSSSYIAIKSCWTESGTQDSIQSLNSICEDKTTILSEYKGSLADLFALVRTAPGACRNGDLSQAPRLVEEHDARDTIRVYKEIVGEDMLEFGYPTTIERRQEKMS